MRTMMLLQAGQRFAPDTFRRRLLCLGLGYQAASPGYPLPLSSPPSAVYSTPGSKPGWLDVGTAFEYPERDHRVTGLEDHFV